MSRMTREGQGAEMSPSRRIEIPHGLLPIPDDVEGHGKAFCLNRFLDQEHVRFVIFHDEYRAPKAGRRFFKRGAWKRRCRFSLSAGMDGQRTSASVTSPGVSRTKPHAIPSREIESFTAPSIALPSGGRPLCGLPRGHYATAASPAATVDSYCIPYSE